jgi:stage V sporulation protein SpoVS
MIPAEFCVASSTRSEALAGAIAHTIRAKGAVDLVAYGPRQVGIAALGAALARDFLAEDGVGMTCEIERAQVILAGDSMGYGVRIALRATMLRAQSPAA